VAATTSTLAALAAALLFSAGLACAAANFTVTNTRSLAFGRFVAGPGGTITVRPDGTRSSVGVILLTSTSTSAAFTLNDNQKNATCSISLPADNAVALANGSSTMPLKTFTTNVGSSCVFSGGTLQLTVGATMTVGANQKPGNYTANIPITVTFN
jgi:hypothetical protein